MEIEVGFAAFLPWICKNSFLLCVLDRMTGRILLYLFLVGSAWVGTSCIRYKRCPVPGCHVRMLHKHPQYFGEEVKRGQPWYKYIFHPSPRIGEDWKGPGTLPAGGGPYKGGPKTKKSKKK